MSDLFKKLINTVFNNSNFENTPNDKGFEDRLDSFITEAEHVSIIKKNEIDCDESKHVRKLLNRFHDVMQSDYSSNEELENVGQQVIVAMQKEGIAKLKIYKERAKEANDRDYVHDVSELYKEQNKRIEEFKSTYGVGLEKNDGVSHQSPNIKYEKSDYIQNILLEDKKNNGRNEQGDLRR